MGQAQCEGRSLMTFLIRLTWSHDPTLPTDCQYLGLSNWSLALIPGLWLVSKSSHDWVRPSYQSGVRPWGSWVNQWLCWQFRYFPALHTIFSPVRDVVGEGEGTVYPDMMWWPIMRDPAVMIWSSDLRIMNIIIVMSPLTHTGTTHHSSSERRATSESQGYSGLF